MIPVVFVRFQVPGCRSTKGLQGRLPDDTNTKGIAPTFGKDTEAKGPWVGWTSPCTGANIWGIIFAPRSRIPDRVVTRGNFAPQNLLRQSASEST